MAKVMLVEDDNNLREIYEARLQAEGYTIVSAQDGEEALVIAKKETPDLIISDVMMPKISGFEMLDILRNTDGLKTVKVIMLTALGQSEDKTRADQLGADKYLVKSQVTLEDIVKTAHQLLDDGAVATNDTPTTTTEPAVATAPAPEPTSTPAPEPTTATNVPVSAPPADTPEPATVPVATTPAELTTSHPVASSSPATPAMTAADPVISQPPTPSDSATAAAAPAPATTPSTNSADISDSSTEAEAQAAMQEQINSFVDTPSPEPPAQAAPTPAATTPASAAENAASDQTLVSNAVDSLVADTNAPGKPSDVTAVEVSPPLQPAPAPALSSDNDTPKPVSDSVAIAHKLIIQPINSPDTKPNLDELLAKESASEAASSPPVAPTANPAPASTTPEPQAATGNSIDPNNIAL